MKTYIYPTCQPNCKITVNKEKQKITTRLLDNSLRALKNKTKQNKTKNSQEKCNDVSCNILSDELVGVVAMVVVIPVSRVPVMAVTLKSPNPPFLTAS